MSRSVFSFDAGRLASYCLGLVADRRLSVVVRDGLLLKADLDQGCLDELFRQYPFLSDRFGSVSVSPHPVMRSVSPRQSDDDILASVVMVKDQSTDSSANFLASMMALQGR